MQLKMVWRIWCCDHYLLTTFNINFFSAGLRFQEKLISESYGKDMGLNSKVSIVFPCEMSALLNAMGMIWDFTKGHSNPIENGPGTPGSLWEWYGIIAYLPSNRYYGEYMELYEIRSNPIWMFSHHMVSLWDWPIPFPYKILWGMYGTLRNT